MTCQILLHRQPLMQAVISFISKRPQGQEPFYSGKQDIKNTLMHFYIGQTHFNGPDQYLTPPSIYCIIEVNGILFFEKFHWTACVFPKIQSPSYCIIHKLHCQKFSLGQFFVSSDIYELSRISCTLYRGKKLKRQRQNAVWLFFKCIFLTQHHTWHSVAVPGNSNWCS